MSTLEIFVLLPIAVIVIGFFYVAFKQPFWNFIKQTLWKMWNGFWIFVLGFLSFFYFAGNEKANPYFLLFIVITVIIGFISIKMAEAKFKLILHSGTHLFRITSFYGKKIYGELAINNTAEVFPARLLCPLHADYKYNDIIPVTVLLCKQNEIIVEPTEIKHQGEL